MAADKQAITLLINGGLAPSFLNSTSKAATALSDLNKHVRQLKTAESSANSLAKLEQRLDETRGKLKESSAETSKLTRAMRSVEKPSAELRRNFEQAKAKSQALKDSFRKQVAQISALRKELTAAGVDTKRLGVAQAGLTAKLNQARAAQERLVSAQSARAANRQTINALYAQGLEAAALGYGLQRALRPSIEFESAMADVAKVVDFQSTEALRNFGGQLKALSRQIPLTATELAEIAAAGGRLGLVENQLPDFVQIVAKMATAFDLLPAEAGEAIAKLSNIFKIPITDIERLGDAVNQLANNTAAREADIVNVLTRVGGTAQQFELTANETAALADAFLALGRPPQVAATAINALLNRLQAGEAQGKKFQEALGSIGYTSTDLAQRIKAGPQRALLGFLDTLKGLDNQARAVVLTDLFGQEYADDISILVGGLDEYRKALGLVANESDYAGGVNAEFQKRLETTEVQLKLLGNTLTEVAANFGSALLPTIRQVASILQSLSGVIADLVAAYPNAAAVIGTVVAGLVSMKIATIAARLAFALLKQPGLAVAEILATIGAKGVAAKVGLEGAAAGATVAAGGVGKFVASLAKLLPILKGGTLISGIAGLAYWYWTVYEAGNKAAEATARVKKNTLDYRAELRSSIDAFRTYADMHIKTSEELSRLSDDELRAYGKRLDEAEQYWRARSLLEQDFTGEVDRQTKARYRLSLQGLRDLSGVLSGRDQLYQAHAERLAEAKAAETAVIRKAFEEQKKVYDDEKRELEKIRKARIAFNESIKELTKAPEPLGRDLVKDTVLEPLRELRIGAAAAGEGDFKTAEQSARRVVEQLTALKEAGKISRSYLNSLAQQAGELGNKAYDGLKKEREAKLEEAKAALLSLKQDAEYLQNLEIGFDNAGALSSMDALRQQLQDKVRNSPIVIPVAAGTDVPKLDDLPKRAGGGAIFGPGTGTSDSILAWLSNGEFVLRAAAVKKYGLGMLNQLNNLQLPGFAAGGFAVPSIPSLPTSALAPAGPAGTPINLHFPDGQSFALQGAPDVAKAVENYFRILLQKRGRG